MPLPGPCGPGRPHPGRGEARARPARPGPARPWLQQRAQRPLHRGANTHGSSTNTCGSDKDAEGINERRAAARRTGVDTRSRAGGRGNPVSRRHCAARDPRLRSSCGTEECMCSDVRSEKYAGGEKCRSGDEHAGVEERVGAGNVRHPQVPRLLSSRKLSLLSLTERQPVHPSVRYGDVRPVYMPFMSFMSSRVPGGRVPISRS